MRVVAAAVLVAALAAGCDDIGQKYNRSDVEHAFRSQGLELLAPNREMRARGLLADFACINGRRAP